LEEQKKRGCIGSDGVMQLKTGKINAALATI